MNHRMNQLFHTKQTHNADYKQSDDSHEQNKR
jgi:hypothetical protein